MTDDTRLVNATMQKFGYPDTLVAETDSWVVLLRPQQVTLGSMVVICREPVTAFGQISPQAGADLPRVMGRVETVLHRLSSYEKINHLMLMMVDLDVHFHVIPRYQGSRTFEGQDFPDAGWPTPPALGTFVDPSPKLSASLLQTVRTLWAEVAD